ncbi:hypothetical protein SAMN06264346_1362, partial [Chryseobacterium profundimaris]
MKKCIILCSLLTAVLGTAQVAIGKTSVTNASVSLEFGNEDRGIVLPWVTSAASVTGAVDGTFIYDISDKKVKYRNSGAWVDLSVDA